MISKGTLLLNFLVIPQFLHYLLPMVPSANHSLQPVPLNLQVTTLLNTFGQGNPTTWTQLHGAFSSSRGVKMDENLKMCAADEHAPSG